MVTRQSIRFDTAPSAPEECVVFCWCRPFQRICFLHIDVGVFAQGEHWSIDLCFGSVDTRVENVKNPTTFLIAFESDVLCIHWIVGRQIWLFANWVFNVHHRSF